MPTRKKSRSSAAPREGAADQALEVALGNSNKLSEFVSTRPPIGDLRALLAVELGKAKGARPHIVEKLRSSISRARSRASKAALAAVRSSIAAGEVPRAAFVARVFGYDVDVDGELTPPIVDRVRKRIAEALR